MNLSVIPSPEVISAFCKDRGISRLSLFGSANREDFDPDHSDVDLLVEYAPARHPGLDHFLIADELSGLFGRKVDLNTPPMLGRHLQKILQEAVVLYDEA